MSDGDGDGGDLCAVEFAPPTPAPERATVIERPSAGAITLGPGYTGQAVLPGRKGTIPEPAAKTVTGSNATEPTLVEPEPG